MRVEQSGSEVFKTRTLAAVVLLGALLPAAADESAVRRMIQEQL